MPKITEKKAWYQMSDEEKAEYDAKVQAEVDASGGKLKKRRKRRKDAKTYEQVKAEIDAKEAAKEARKAAKRKPKFMPTSEAFNIMNYGLSAILETTRGLQKAFEKRAEREQKLEDEKKIDAARLLSKQKAENKEKALEQRRKPGGKTGGKIKAAAKKGGLRIMTAIVAIIAGFLINNLPKIMKFMEKVMKVLKGFWKLASPILEVVFNIMHPIMSGLAKLLPEVTSVAVDKQLEKTKSEMEQAEDSLKKTKEGLDENIENTKKEIDKTKEDLQKRANEGQTPEEIVKEKAGKEVKMKGETEKKQNEVKQKNDTTDKAETLKKETKETQVVMTEKIEPQEEKPRVIIEKPPESIEGTGTLTVKMDEKAGVGDGKSAKKVVTPQGLGMDMYSKPIVLGDEAAEGWKKVLKAAAEDGIDLTKAVTSSRRSPEQQEALMESEDGSTVIDPATPGTSEHVKGRALDIAVNTPEHDWMINNASKYGWKWQGVSDPFHFNFIGADSAETKIANRQGLRNKMIQKKIDRDKDFTMLGSRSGKTVVPVPINKIQPIVPSVVPGGSEEKTMSGSSESGSNIMDTMKTLNTSLT